MCGTTSTRRLRGTRTLVIGLIAAGTLPTWGQEEGLDPAAQAQAARQRETAFAEQFVAELQLTPAQARRLLPTVEKAADLYVQRYHEQAGLIPQMLEAYGAFAEEDRLNQGFSEEVEGRTARLHHREVVLRDEYARRLIALETEAEDILTPAQRETATQFHPGRLLRRAATAGRVVRGQHQPLAPEQAELSEARETLRGLHEQRHPQVGILGRRLLEPAGFAALCELAGQSPSSRVDHALQVYVRGTSEYPIERLELDRAALAKLRDTINNWNLINGLHLNQSQIARIVGLFDAATPAAQHPRHRGQRPVGTMLLALEQAVEKVLNPGQLQVLAEYKPCLMPPKNLRDPVRIGQATDHSGLEQWLARTRRLSGKELSQAIDEALVRQADRFGQLTPVERRERRALLMRTIRAAALLSDTEFELARAELATSIAPPDREQELHETISTLERQLGQPGRVAYMMLKPDFIEQLRQRGQQLAAGEAVEPADLAAQPQAESCAAGCAINPKKPKSETTWQRPDADE